MTTEEPNGAADGYSELHALFGYGEKATRVMNILIRNDVTTERLVRQLTPSDLKSLRGMGEGLTQFVLQSLDFVDRQRKHDRRQAR